MIISTNYTTTTEAYDDASHQRIQHIGALCPYLMTLATAAVNTISQNYNNGSCTSLLYPPSLLPHQISIGAIIFIIIIILTVVVNVMNFVGVVAVLTPVEHPMKKWALNVYYKHFVVKTQNRQSHSSSSNNHSSWWLANLKTILYPILIAILFHQNHPTTTNTILVLSTITISFILQKTLDEPLEMDGPQSFFEHALQVERRRMVEQFKPMPVWFYRLLNAPVKLLTGTPEWYGLDNIKGATTSSASSSSSSSPTTEASDGRSRPALYVMNHSRYGIEMSCTVGDLYEKTGVHLRGLGDNSHFLTPVGSVLKVAGAVQGTRENINALMEAGEDVLVYPGGAHEIMKPSTCPNYSLHFWKERLGFVRYAIKNNYDIIPIACVGAEELVDVAYDVDVTMIRKDLKIPIPSLPKLQKLQKMYFWTGERISTDHFNGADDYLNDEICRTIRDKTRASLLSGIEFLQQRQAEDPRRFLTQQIFDSLSSIFLKLKGSCSLSNEQPATTDNTSVENSEDDQKISNESPKVQSSSSSSSSLPHRRSMSIDEDSDGDDESTDDDDDTRDFEITSQNNNNNNNSSNEKHVHFVLDEDMKKTD